MIISGGVNIYPQEIENHLVTHPKVADVAVVGGPHEEMGEEVIAVVQPADMADATDAFREELGAYAREKLSGVKVPRRIDFMEALPRDRKSTRLNSSTNAHLVCRLLLEKKKKHTHEKLRD